MQKVNFFTSYYKCGDPERQKELDFCMLENQKRFGADNVYNIVVYVDGEKTSLAPTFNDFFKKTEGFPDDINIFANADIYFNDTVNLIQGIKKEECYALTRWEIMDGELVTFEEKNEYNKEAKARHSQDVWVFNGAVTRVNGAFHVGVPGIDNRMAYEISRAYSILNPSNMIQCIHKHENDSRDYNIPSIYRERIPPPYKWVNVKQDIKTTSKARKPI